MPAPIVALCNLKGGVGKTSTTFHLAGTMAQDGRRVLCLDVDPQASLTQGFFGPDVMRSLPRHATIAALFGDGLTPTPDELVRPTSVPGLAIVPGSGYLTRHNVPEPWLADPVDQRALAEFVAEVRGDFDVIMLDCPPNLHLCAWAALVAADHLIVPLQAEDFGSQGIAAILDCVDAVRSGPNPGLALAGYLLTMHNPRLGVHRAYETMLRELYGPEVFTTTIPLGADFKESVAVRKPIALYKPKGASAKSIKALSDELFSRVSCTVQDDASDDASRRVA
ncbi:ParA family protein (plasmid) [Isosphaeraceae bacterium EP7]